MQIIAITKIFIAVQKSTAQQYIFKNLKMQKQCLNLMFLMSFLSVDCYALTENHLRVFEVFPNQYAQYGVTPFFGPVDENQLQTVTLIVEQDNAYGVVTQVLVHYHNHKNELRLSVPLSYECSDENRRCFIEFFIHERYQNNIEVGIHYQADTHATDIKGARYLIKDLGAISGMIQKHHHIHD